MNAKKIMGAVLVALLAAALFVGAGAAAATSLSFYQDTTGITPGTYVYDGDDGKTGQFTITTPGTDYVSDINLPVGKYVDVSTPGNVIMLSFPTASVGAALVKDNSGSPVIAASIAGMTLPASAKTNVSFSVAGTTTDEITLIFTNPQGVKTFMFGGFNFSTLGASAQVVNLYGMAQGEWKVQAYFNMSAATPILVDGTPANLLYGADVLTFTIAPAEISIAAAVDSATVGDAIAITVTGTPGEAELVFSNDGAFTFVPGQPGVDAANNKVTIPNVGTITFYLNAKDDGSQTITVKKDGKSAKVTLSVAEGELTIEADKESYFLGQDVVLSGINNGGANLFFYIEGNNFAFQPINEIDENINGKEWEAEVDGTVFTNMNLDAGTYSIFVSTENVDDKEDLDNYASASVALKQPFLSADAESNIVAKGATLKINGIAESTDNVQYYVFGTNYFATDVKSVDTTDSTFLIKVPTTDMDAGQYFVVVQHPMYDEVYEIAPFATAVENASAGLTEEQVNANITAYVEKNGYNIVLNSAGEAVGDVDNMSKATAVLNETKVEYPNEIIFNTMKRQSSNAAEALCQALDDQNIDDIYVKLSFIVASPMASMNAVASEVVKGEKLTVSGTSNYPAGEMVTVQMASTAFGAIPKESVNTASFITLSTKVQEDGTWEVTFDTTGLNVDEYTIQATVGEFQNTAKVNLVEGAPVTPEQPDTPVTPEQPEQPTEPEAPATPGFGALAALAGLGAVAVLLLRRE